MSRLARILVMAVALLLLLPQVPVIGSSIGAAPAEAARSFGSTPLDDVLYWAGQEKRCGLSTNELAALMLAPTFPETGAPSSSSPAPMTMSRWDNQSGLHSFGSSSTYTRAFWHPGIGPWQFDSAGLGTYLGANGRIDTFVSAAHAADTMATRWCASSGSTSSRRSYVWAPWYGCGSTTCHTIFAQIYNGSSPLGVNRQAGVTRTGGMQKSTCSSPGRSGTFTCWRVDPSRAEGHRAFTATGFGPAPITAPFYVYTVGGREYRHWLRADTGYDTGVWASRALGANARSAIHWHSGQPLVDRGAEPPPPPTPGPGGFWDVADGAWFVEGLLWAVDAGVVYGYPDETFRPGNSTTRAEAVTMLWRAQGEPTVAGGHGFGDVSASVWYDAALDWAASLGVVTGYPDATFRPNNKVTRAQFVSMLWRVAGSQRVPNAAAFADVQPDSWYTEAVSWAAARGYVWGYPNGTFGPTRPIARAELVTILWRARPFDDVAASDPFATAVDWARYHGVTTGYGGTHTYQPAKSSNRAQVVSMFYRVMDSPQGSPPHPFIDVDPNTWYDEALSWAAANGVVNGYSDGSFQPATLVDQAQFITMLWRVAGAPDVTEPHGLNGVTPGVWYEAPLRWATAHNIFDGLATIEPHRVLNRGEMAILLHNLASSPNAWSPAIASPSTLT